MVLRKAAISTTLGFNASAVPITPISCSIPTQCRSSNPPHLCSRRWYATPHDHISHNNSAGDKHPAWPSSKNPSPYDIFAINRSDPYTKKRFYQLVKLYHPDLSHAAHVPADVRLERYRLVVAANNVLSDPVKRQAYDNHGLGWGNEALDATEYARRADRSWRQQPGNASRNATWEDWERWHEANGNGQPGRRQEAQYMPNGVFAMLLAMTCIIGAMLQSQRVDKVGEHYVEMKAQRHQAVGEEVRRSTEASAGLSQDQRVHRFLRDRENVAFQFAPGKYDEFPPKDDYTKS